MSALIHKDRDKGWLIKRQQKPAHITALHHVVQKNKLRLVTDFSKPKGLLRRSTDSPAP
jgi:hypothetical protein